MSDSTKTREATPLWGVASFISRTAGLGLLSLAALLAVLLTLDVGDDCRWSADGPGLTFDEPLNIEGGVFLVESALQNGIASLHPQTLQEIFESPGYHPDYPPWGRIPLGLANALFSRLLGTDGQTLYVVTYARIASAVLFALTALLIGLYARHKGGSLAGYAAAGSYCLTPRVFAHAHLASVETAMNLAYVAVVLGSAWLLTDRQTLRLRHGILPGGLLGLALLVKMQAVFLPPLLVVWMLAFWGRQAILPVLAMAGVATAVFFAGWPWLWADPVHRFLEYFAQTTDRAVLYCYYFGHRYADRSVPWHYPFVMFLITTPVPFLLLGLWGVFLRRRSKRRADAHRRQFRLSRRENALLAGGVLIPLLVFSLTNAPVYDGERLFLVIWPLFSVWVGIATRQAFDKLRSHWNSTAAAGLLALGFCLPLFSLIADAPCWLSSYSLLCGQLRGAAQLGMEVNYWGDALTPCFLRSVSDQLPEGARVGIAPVLHPIYVDGLKKHSWLRHRPDLTLQAFNDQDSDPPEYVLHVLRRADPWVILETPRSKRTVLGTVRRESTDLAHCLKFDWGAVPRESVSLDSVSRGNTSQPEP